MSLKLYVAPSTQPGEYPLVAHAATWRELAAIVGWNDRHLRDSILGKVRDSTDAAVVTIVFTAETAAAVQRIAE